MAGNETTSGALTVDRLLAIMPNNVSYERANRLLPMLASVMTKFSITTKLRAAAFLAQLAHESAEFYYLEEIGGPNAWYAPYYNQALEVLPQNLTIGGGDLVFEKYNLVAAPDAPWDRALAAYHGKVGQYGCLVVGRPAHDHLDPMDKEFDVWKKGIDTWKCWTDDRSNEGTLRVLRNQALKWIAAQEGKPGLVERFDKILKPVDPRFEGALRGLSVA